MINRNSAVRELSKGVQISLPVRSLSIEQFTGMIETKPGFSFARLSDGGFFCMQGRKGVNCDGVVYTSEQSSALLGVMRDPNITHGITSIAIYTANAAGWLNAMNIVVDWYDADVMNKASDTGNLLPFVECLRKRKSVVVGPSHLTKLGGFPISAFISCHPTQAFEEVDELEMEIAYRLQKIDADTILLSAGQGASPTLVSRLHSLYPKLVIIDVGSLWDPYVGVLSRSGHKKVGREGYIKLGRQNFGEDVNRW